MKTFALTIVLAAAAPARAEPTVERCAAGVAFARVGDLPRAALYLDGCQSEDALVAAAEVARRLRASELSALTIITTPEGMIGETDALPGERFTTPATIWAKAGTYTVRVGQDAATLSAHAITNTAKLAPRTRGSLIIAGPAKPALPKDGKVDFTEETPEQTAHQGPPAAVKHGTLLPKKYREPGEASGPGLEDPFAAGADRQISWRLGARVATGILDRGDAGVGLAIAATAARPLAGPAWLAARLDWSHRDLDIIAANVGVAFELVDTGAIVWSAGAAMRGEARLQGSLAMQPVARAGVGGAAELGLALRRIPVAWGVRVEQGFTEVVPGARSRALLFELGYDWR